MLAPAPWLTHPYPRPHPPTLSLQKSPAKRHAGATASLRCLTCSARSQLLLAARHLFPAFLLLPHRKYSARRTEGEAGDAAVNSCPDNPDISYSRRAGSGSISPVERRQPAGWDAGPGSSPAEGYSARRRGRRAARAAPSPSQRQEGRRNVLLAQAAVDALVGGKGLQVRPLLLLWGTRFSIIMVFVSPWMNEGLAGTPSSSLHTR